MIENVIHLANIDNNNSFYSRRYYQPWTIYLRSIYDELNQLNANIRSLNNFLSILLECIRTIFDDDIEKHFIQVVVHKETAYIACSRIQTIRDMYNHYIDDVHTYHVMYIVADQRIFWLRYL